VALPDWRKNTYLVPTIMALPYTLQLEYHFPKNAEEVYAHILDLRKFGDVHPYMVKVNALPGKEYEIFEEFPIFGPLKMSPTYKATVTEVEQNKRIRYTSSVKKNLSLIIHFDFIMQVDRSLKLVESIEVTGNGIICRIFLRILRNAHEHTFRRLRVKTESL
jgi:hypothetical protein